MKKKAKVCLLALSLIISMGCLLTHAQAANLNWQTSKQDALDLAVQQGKKILLLAGRDT